MNDITTYNDDGNKYETIFSRCQGQTLSKHAEAEAAAKAFCVWRDIAVGATPDEQFGTVCTFPSEMLDHLFSDVPH